MCGLAGYIDLKRNKIDEKILWAMTDALAHRGPDDRGIYIDRFVGLGNRRLSIIDLSESAHQPMVTEQRDNVISYVGEVYNFRELRRELEKKGLNFQSQSDTEVVLKSFAQMGHEILPHYNGMFSFAFWDKKKLTLTLARDRYGIKPLYYWQNSNVFLFASEIKSFLKHPQFRVQVDAPILLEYFTFQNTFSYKTLFQGVKILSPGHYMQIKLSTSLETVTKLYWDFHFEEDPDIKSDEEYFEECDRLFQQAVRRQLVSDVEVGAYLSGGIDTGSIVAIASQQFKYLKTFCIGFDLSSVSGLERSFDERGKAEHISYLYQTEHYEMVLKSGDMQRCLPYLVWALEDLRLGQSYPNFYASKLASRFTKVCLSGGGGDELFAGYPWRYYRTFQSRNFNEYLSEYYKYWQRMVPNPVLQELFVPIWDEVKETSLEDIFKNVFSNYRMVLRSHEDYINHSLYFEAKTFLHGLLIVEDKLSMTHGLEVRVPFLDNDFVDFALKLPIRLKLSETKEIARIDEDDLIRRKEYFLRTNDGKVILRQVLKKYVGDRIAGLHKQGFSGPDASWFKGESIDYVRNLLLNKKANIYIYLDFKTTQKLIDEHLKGTQNHRLFIWSLLNFEWWLRIFLKGENII